MLQPHAEQRADARGPGPEDEHRILLRDLRDACGPEPRGEDVAHEQRLRVAHRRGDAAEPLVGVRYPHVGRLPAVDAAPQGPSAVRIRAVIDVSAAAEEAFAAEGLDVDRHAVADPHGAHCLPYLLDDADHLVPDGDARHGAGHASVADVEVAGADARQRDAHDGVARVFQYGPGLLPKFEAALFYICIGFHGWTGTDSYSQRYEFCPENRLSGPGIRLRMRFRRAAVGF